METELKNDLLDIIATLLDIIGATVRYTIAKLFGSKKDFKYYSRNFKWLNRWIGVIIVALLIFVIVRIIQVFGD